MVGWVQGHQPPQASLTCPRRSPTQPPMSARMPPTGSIQWCSSPEVAGVSSSDDSSLIHAYATFPGDRGGLQRTITSDGTCLALGSSALPAQGLQERPRVSG